MLTPRSLSAMQIEILSIALSGRGTVADALRDVFGIEPEKVVRGRMRFDSADPVVANARSSISRALKSLERRGLLTLHGRTHGRFYELTDQGRVLLATSED